MTPENAIQAASASFLDRALRHPAIWFHVPNGGHRDPRVAAKLKGQGVKAGVADILVFWPHGARMAAIELKSDIGTLETEQREWAEMWIRCGGLYALARSVEDVETALRFWAVPLFATTLRQGAPLIIALPEQLPPAGRLVFSKAARRIAPGASRPGS